MKLLISLLKFLKIEKKPLELLPGKLPSFVFNLQLISLFLSEN